MSSVPKPDTAEIVPDVREEMVRTAIKFLENQNVINTPLAQKQKFLQRKGLTDKEIQIACEKSGAYTQHEQQNKIAPPLPLVSSDILQHYNSYNRIQVSLFDRIREIVHNIAIFSIVAYFVHKFYKKYLEPFLFGTKRKSVEDNLQEVKTTVTELKNNLECVKVEVSKISENNEGNLERQLGELKSDLATVKGLLLNRKQFPSVANSPVVPPSIPAWQMSSVQQDNDQDADQKEDLLEIASGSGSEPEHCTKTSESSLEIIYSSRDCDSESCNSRKSKEDLEKD